MSVVNKGFRRRHGESAREVPPGQHLTTDFPVLQAGPTPRIDLDDWRFTIRDELGTEHSWSWPQFKLLPSEPLTVDIHCVTTWSKLDTEWEGVSLDTVLEATETAAEFALIGSYGGYTTNLPLRDLRGGKAWIVHGYQGAPLSPVHGGPARSARSIAQSRSRVPSAPHARLASATTLSHRLHGRRQSPA